MVGMKWGWLAACAAIGVALLCSQSTPRDSVAGLRAAFAHPPDDCRIMMRWWWFGAAVEKPELERELRAMKEGGMGGVEIQPVYPLTLDDPARGLVNLPYLSDGFLDALRFANDKARELGMRVDLTLTSGWPYGGPHTPVELAAGRLRVERLNAIKDSTVPPKMGEGEQFLAAFVKGKHGYARYPDIETAMGAAGNSVADSGGWVLVFISSRTHQHVKRAAVGAEGLVLDHYSRAAIENHLHFVGDRLMQAFGAHPPYTVFSDSLEVYGSDWTGDFLAEFRKRRGYDLTPYLPALAGEMGSDGAAIRHDWGKTLTELANEHYLTPLRQWAAAHGTRFRSQNYGIPPVNLSSNALVDLPEGEGSQWRRFTPTRWAASAGHLYGRRVISSECWTWLHSPVFRATPLDLKAEADLHFLQGINQLVGHGWPYSPPQAGEPGWHFYAAAVLNQHNPWWIVMPDIAAYLQRVSWLLRQGEPANDVALYLPTDDAYAQFTPGHDSVSESMDRLLGPNVIPQILDSGYNFDFIDDDAIAAAGVRYPVLVLPNVERMPAATLAKIAEYAKKGGTVIAAGRVPSLAPGFRELQADTPKIREMARALFEAPGARGHLVKDEAKLGETLRGWLQPDLTAPPEIGFVHRKLPLAQGSNLDLYFLVNTSNHRVDATVRIRSVLPRDYWDPMTGETAGIPDDLTRGDTFEVNLAAYESKVVVGQSGQGFYEMIRNPYSHAAGAPPEPMDVSGGWTVRFAGSSQPVTMDHLVPWPGVKGRKNFSGTATYEKTFTVDAARLAEWRAKTRIGGRRLFLDFGEGTPVTTAERRAGNGMRAMLESPVREAAIVYVNGQRAGAVWHPPYEVEVTGLIHGGENALRIVVANLAINALAAGPPPDYRALIAQYGDRFQDQDMKAIGPLPAGILGPVRIVAR